MTARGVTPLIVLVGFLLPVDFGVMIGGGYFGLNVLGAGGCLLSMLFNIVYCSI